MCYIILGKHYKAHPNIYMRANRLKIDRTNQVGRRKYERMFEFPQCPAAELELIQKERMPSAVSFLVAKVYSKLKEKENSKCIYHK